MNLFVNSVDRTKPPFEERARVARMRWFKDCIHSLDCIA